MKIRITVAFQNKFYKQLDFIAKDKPVAAKKFEMDIVNRINDIIKMPFKNKKSRFYDDDTIRELTFKGYTIIYRIDELKKQITVFGFMKYVEKPNQ